MALVIESAGLSDVGQKRKGNEDSLFLDDRMGLYVVADGMGGHLAGEVASKIVVDTIRDYMGRFGREKNPEELEDHDASLSKEANRLLSSVHLANQAVHSMAGQKKAYTGMGSTVSAVYTTDAGFVIVNVGDSPIYLVHQGALEPIYVPHTVIAEQAAMDPEAVGRLSEKFAHMLTRAMGVEDTVAPSVLELQAWAGDTIIIASDGLTNMVEPDEIKKVLLAEPPQSACRTLVDLANARGGDDNITVIIIKVKRVSGQSSGLSGIIERILEFFK